MALNANVGTAWISVVSDTAKIAPGIKKAIGDAEKNISGEGIGSKLSAGIGKTLKIGAATAGAAVGGILATSVAKGFGRLNAIDQATAKLDALGNSGESVQSIMDNALASVKGTAFGIGEAAGTAATMVASGIKPGEQLESVLKGVADSAAIAGSDMNEMGLIWGKAAAKGKIDGEIVAQLLERQIPIYDILSQKTGAASEDIADMVSKGKIDFQTFADAMNDYVGGGAVRMGQTVSGAMDNLMASTGRFGAALTGPMFAAAPALLSSFTTVFDDLTTAVGPAAEKIGGVLTPALESLAGLVESKLSPRLGELVGKAGDLAASGLERALDPSNWEYVGEVFGKISATAAELWPSLRSLGESFLVIAQNVSVATWTALTSALNALAPLIETVLVPLIQNVAEFSEQNPGAVQAIVIALLGFKAVSVVAGPVGTVTKTLGNLGGAVSGVSKAFKGATFGQGLLNLMGGAKSANPILAKLGGVVGKVFGAFWKLMPVLSKIGKVFLTAIRFVNPWVAGITAIVGALTWFFTKTETGKKIWESFTDSISNGVDWVKGKFEAFTGRVSTAWSGITSLFTKGDYSSAIYDAFGIEEDSPIIAFFLNIRNAIVETYDRIKGFFSDVKNLATGIVDILFRGDYTGLPFGLEEDSPIVGMLLNIRDIVLGIADTFQEAWGKLKTGDFVGAIATIFSGIKDAASKLWNAVIEYVQQSWENLKLGTVNLWSAAKTQTANAWDSIKETVSDKWDDMVDYISTTFTWDNIKETVSGMWDSVVASAETAWVKVESTASEVWDSVSRSASNAWEDAKTNASNMWDNVKSGGVAAWGETQRIASLNWDSIKKIASEGWDNVWSSISGGASNIWTSVTSGAETMRSTIIDKARSAFDWASDNKITSGPAKAIEGVFKGIKDQWDELTPKLQPIRDAASDLWGFLSGKGSEYSGEARSGIAGLIDNFRENAEKLQEKIQPVKDAASDLWDALTGKVEQAQGEARSGIAGLIDEFTNNVTKLQEKIQPAKDAAKSIWDAITGKSDPNAAASDGEAGGVSGLVKSITDNIIKFRDEAQPVIDRFKEKWDELKKSMEPLLDSISDKLGKAAKIIGGATLVVALTLLLSPFIILAGVVYGALVAINAIADTFSWMAQKWTEAKDKLTLGWNWIRDNVITPFKTEAGILQQRLADAVEGIKLKWQELQDKLTAVWEWIKINVIQAFIDKMYAFWNDHILPILTWVGDKWIWLRDKFSEGWNWIRDNVFTKFQEGLDGLKNFASSTVDAIRDVWQKLKGYLAEPINFMINTVYNNGIRRAWNVMAGDGTNDGFLPGLKSAPAVAPIQGYRAGGEIQNRPTGRISGPGTGTSDSILARIANGEHMWTAAEVKALGSHERMYRLRNLILNNIPFTTDGKGHFQPLPRGIDNSLGDLAGAAPDLLPKFKDGGEIKPAWESQLEAAHRFAKAQHGKPYQWAGPTGPGSSFDCSGFMGSIAATIQGTNPWQRYWATMSFPSPGAQGFVPGLGQGFSIGVWNGGPYGGHTSGTLSRAGNFPTTNVESGGSPSMVKYGIGAAGADSPQHKMHFHLPIGADGSFESGGAGGGFFDFLGGIKSWIAEKFGKILDPIKDKLPTPPPEWLGIPGAAYKSGKDALTKTVTEKVENLGDLTSAVWAKLTDFDFDLFDTGGVWKPGRVGLNLSGKNEYVFTNKSMQSFQQATESLKIVSRELSEAFAGGDYGYGELASYVGEDIAHTLVNEAFWLGGAKSEIVAAFDGVDNGLASVARYLGGNEKLARDVLSEVENLGTVGKEFSAAFRGEDFGSGATGSYIGQANAERLLDEVSWIGATVDEVKAAWKGQDSGYAGVMRYLGGNAQMAVDALNAVESAGTVAAEISEAFAGGNWGTGEMERYVGPMVAQAVFDTARAAGSFMRREHDDYIHAKYGDFGNLARSLEVIAAGGPKAWGEAAYDVINTAMTRNFNGSAWLQEDSPLVVAALHIGNTLGQWQAQWNQNEVNAELRKSAEDYALGEARSALNLVGLGDAVDIALGLGSKAQEVLNSDDVRNGVAEVKRLVLDPSQHYLGEEIEKKVTELGVEVEHLKSELGSSTIGGYIGMA